MWPLEVLIETIKREYENWHPPIPRDAHLLDSYYREQERLKRKTQKEDVKTSRPYYVKIDHVTGEKLLQFVDVDYKK